MNELCGAKTRSGAPCRKAALPNGRCRLHGGLSPGGIASPSLKHGRHSQYLPQRLQERYAASLDDPDLLNLSAEITLVDARLSELLERVDAGESDRAWTELHAAWDAVQIAKAGGNLARLKEAMAKLEQVFARSRDAGTVWAEVLEALKVRERLVASERKRLVQMEALLDSAEALVLARFLVESVRRHVDDPRTLAKIQADFSLAVRGRD